MGGDLQTLLQDAPGLREAIGCLLERAERAGGRLPKRMTLRVPAPVADGLRAVFSPRVVHTVAPDAVRLDIEAFLRDRGPDAESVLLQALYAATERTPSDPAADARALRRSLERVLTVLEAGARTEVARAVVRGRREEVARDERARIFVHACEHGLAATSRLISNVVRCVDAVAVLQEPVRVQTFAARVVGSSKALRRSGELFRWVGEALVAHDPRTQTRIEECAVAPGSSWASALEVNGVLYDEAAASVLCFGPLIYEKGGQSFDQVARHAVMGESSRLVHQQVRDSILLPPAARRVTIFENLAPYLDYVDACVSARRSDEIVVCSGGQANLAVIELLARLAALAVPMRHAGDLDRSGVLIARSLMKRSGALLELVAMNPATHRRFASSGSRLSNEERTRLAALVRTDHPGAPGHALLREVLRTGIWIEQEAFAEEVLDAMLA